MIRSLYPWSAIYHVLYLWLGVYVYHQLYIYVYVYIYVYDKNSMQYNLFMFYIYG